MFSETFPAEDIDALWPSDGETTFTNHGSFGRVPAPTVRRLHALSEEEERNPQRWFRSVDARVAEARSELARWIGAHPDRTGLVRNASAGMTVALNTLGPQPCRTIVFTDHIYGAVRNAIERTCARTGAEPVEVPIALDADDDTIVATLEAQLDGAAMLVVDQITSATAKLMPVQRLTASCRAAGVPIAIDGAHAPGQLAEPLEGLDRADFWTGNFHKWPCSPRGTAVVVVAADRLDTVPLIASWHEHEPFASRFDRQGTGPYGNWLAAPHAIRLIEDRLGWDRVRSHMATLGTAARDLVADTLGTPTVEVGRHGPGLRLVQLPQQVRPDLDGIRDLSNRLSGDHGIEHATTLFRGTAYLRLSIHAYNRLEDYQRLADAVRATSPVGC